MGCRLNMLGPMARAARLDHCVIHVSDWAVSNAFYGEVMGAEVVRVGERWAYRFGEQQLNVHGPGARVTEVARLPVQPGNSDLCFEWPGRALGGARQRTQRLLPRPGRQPDGVHLLPMITCHVRYEIDPAEIDAFERSFMRPLLPR